MASVPQPSIGRIVHYRHMEGGICQAAIVLKVWSKTTVDLSVLRDGSYDDRYDGRFGENELVVRRTSVTLDPTPEIAGNTPRWHWPEFVPPTEEVL